MTRYASTLAVTLVLSGAQAAPALALNNRTWISGTGTDAAGCGPIANPCRTLQFAHDQTSAGGDDPVVLRGLTFVSAGGLEADTRHIEARQQGDQSSPAVFVVRKPPSSGVGGQSDVEPVFTDIDARGPAAMIDHLRRPCLASEPGCSGNHPGPMKRPVAIQLSNSPQSG